jgi:parvulin-like peptidyl-prolyl isomerase
MRFLGCILVLIAGSATALRAELVNAILAVVDSAVITSHQVREVTAPATAELRRQAGGDFAAFNRRLTDALNTSLNQLIDQQVILREFATSGYSLPESIIDEVVDERIRQRWGDRRTLTKSLQAEGRTYEAFRRQLRDQVIVEAMSQRNAGRDRIISPLKIERYYENNLEQFTLEDRVRLSMIVLNKEGGTNDPAPALARELLQKIQQGESFGDLAATYSEGSQRSERGDWGWVTRTTLREELAEVAFQLKAGEVSEVIETESTCYIMRVEEIERSPRKPLTEVQEEIERTLQSEERSARHNRWIDRLKSKTFIRYY